MSIVEFSGVSQSSFRDHVAGGVAWIAFLPHSLSSRHNTFQSVSRSQSLHSQARFVRSFQGSRVSIQHFTNSKDARSYLQSAGSRLHHEPSHLLSGEYAYVRPAVHSSASISLQKAFPAHTSPSSKLVALYQGRGMLKRPCISRRPRSRVVELQQRFDEAAGILQRNCKGRAEFRSGLYQTIAVYASQFGVPHLWCGKPTPSILRG